MVILFLLAGGVIGAFAASLALWSGGSVLFALLCYSVFGSLGALLVVTAVYLRNGAQGGTADWHENQKSKQPLSA